MRRLRASVSPLSGVEASPEKRYLEDEYPLASTGGLGLFASQIDGKSGQL